MSGLSVPQVKSATLCGCTSCDDIMARVTLTVQHRDTKEPVAAAQIYRKDGDQMEMIGLTNNAGFFIHTEPVESQQLTLHIVAPNFIPYTLQPITLRPERPITQITVSLIPLMNLEVGLGGSPITIRLGTMAAISAPPDAFTMMETNETYQDLVVFRGNVMTSSDDNEFLGVPGNSFMGMNEETNEMETYSVVLVTYLEFQTAEGEMLTSDKLRLGVSLLNTDGNLPPLSLIYYDPNRGYWVNLGPLDPIEPFRKKRQTDPAPNPAVLQADGVPIDIFVAVAANNNANCWLQARTFDESGNAFPNAVLGLGDGPLVTLFQRSDISGNRFLFQFGTDTGNAFNTALERNAICLPLRCEDFTVATLEAFEDDNLGSPSLLPLAFPEDMFNMSTSAPLEIGTFFTWVELFFPNPVGSVANPFYPDSATCRANASQSNPERGDYFSFQLQPMIDFPLANETCFIKIQIRDCFLDNEVRVTSINPNTGAIDATSTTLVGEPAEIFDATTTGSGFGTTMPATTGEIPTTPAFTCDETTATLRAACLEFVCGDSVQIIVRPNAQSDQTSFCEVTGRSLLVNTEVVSELTRNDQLLLRLFNVKSTDFNDPNLGLYFDEGAGQMSSMIAEERCNAGTGTDTSDMINVETGVAATFSCF